MLAALSVGAGGFVGAVARYLVGLVPCEGDFPFATFVVNVVGAVVIGMVVEAASAVPTMPANAVLFLKTGVCGGFTTFSTFSLETLALLEDGKYAMGVGYAAASLVVCVAGVAAGRALMRALLSLGLPMQG